MEPSKVEIKAASRYDMMEVWIDGECFESGNIWDFRSDVWIDVLEKCGIEVAQTTYQYNDCTNGGEVCECGYCGG